MYQPLFAGCIFPFQSNALTVGENQLCCNYSSLSIAPPRVFVGGTLQGNLQNAQHSTCDIVYLVPVSQRLDGLEIAVSYGTMTEGRWNTTIYFREFLIYIYKDKCKWLSVNSSREWRPNFPIECYTRPQSKWANPETHDEPAGCHLETTKIQDALDPIKY